MCASVPAGAAGSAADEKVLAKTIARYGRVDLLMGATWSSTVAARAALQVLTECEASNSVAIASNQSFSGWTSTFIDPRLCAAITGRLTHHGTIIETGTTPTDWPTAARRSRPTNIGQVTWS